MCSWQRLLHHLLTHTHTLRIVCVCVFTLFNDFTSSLLINVDPQELFPVLVVSYVSQNASEQPEKCQKIVLMLLFFFLRAPTSPRSKRNTSEAKMKLRSPLNTDTDPKTWLLLLPQFDLTCSLFWGSLEMLFCQWSESLNTLKLFSPSFLLQKSACRWAVTACISWKTQQVHFIQSHMV